LGLRPRLVVTFACVAALVSVAVAFISYVLVRDATVRRAVDTAVREARVHLESAAATLPAEPTRQQLRGFLAGLRARGVFDVVAVDDGIAETTTISLTPAAVPAELMAAVDEGRVAAVRTTVTAQPVVVVGGAVQPDGPAFSFFFPLDAIYADLALLARVLAATSGVLVLVSAGIGAVAAAGVLRPIRRTRNAVRSVAAGDLDAELPEVGSDELAELARAFNRMTAAVRRTVGELQELEAGQRRFVSDVSHELRTPLTALTTAAEVLDANTDGLGDTGRRAARLIVVETRRLAALVEDLMEISRMDAGAAEVTLEAIDVAANVEGALRVRGWRDRVALRADGHARTLIDPRRLDTIVANLVGNALDHGGSPVAVTVRATADTVEVAVSDGGQGIAPQHLSRVFDRFYKADRSRSASGSGLGLAIARENARLHGGDITVDSRPGHGTTFTLSLPRRRASDSEPASGLGT
jgi:two-component system sensor histidine kinase MtrB